MPTAMGSRRAKRRGAVVVAVGALLIGGACGDDAGAGAAAWDTPIRRPGPVLLVGDSIFFQSAGELATALKDDGWEAVIDARPGAGIAGGAPELPVHWPQRVADLARASKPALVVVELGTNGCQCDVGGNPEEAVGDAIDAILEPLADVPVLWLVTRNPTTASEDPEAVHDAIVRAADEHGQVRLVPYDEWFDARPELLDDDGVHLRPAGERYLAERVTETVRDVAA